MPKKEKVIITQKQIDKIIPPLNTEEDIVKFSKMCEKQYEQGLQVMIDIMNKNLEQYKDK